MDMSRVALLIDKMRSHDKDFRYMALSDLMNQIGTYALSEEQSAAVGKQLISMISDKNTEVQNLAVKCIGTIMPNMKFLAVQLSVKMCCTIVKDKENKEAEMYASALKEMVAHLKDDSSVSKDIVIKDVIPCLLLTCSPDYADGVRFESLDILAEVILRHGSAIASEHETIKSAIDSRVRDKNYSIVKRANTVIGNLLMFCQLDLYNTVVEEMLTSIVSSSESVQKARIGALVLAAKAKPTFFNAHVPKVVELLLTKLSKTEDDEFMETILQAFDVIIQKCPLEIEPFVPKLQKVLQGAMVYDPNYEGGVDDEEEDSSQKEEYDSDYVYSDDDDLDLSWKARRSAAKALQSLIEHQRGMPSIVKSVAPLLVSRFRERDEGVICEVIASYATLVRCVRKLKESDMPSHLSSVEDLRLNLSTVIKAMDRLLRHKSLPIRTACFDVLSELTKTISNCFAGNMDVVFNAVSAPINDVGDNSQQLKVVALRFFYDVLESHEHVHLTNHVAKFATVLAKAVGNTAFSKISFEALSVAEKFCDFMQLKCDSRSILALLEAMERLLASLPFEQEARDRCIGCLGRIVADFGEILGEKAYTVSLTLMEHAQPTHTTCRIAMNSLANVAKSPSKSVLESVASRLVDVCCNHLKAEKRDSKAVAIRLFESAVENGILTTAESVAMAGQAVLLVMCVVASEDHLFTQSAVRCLAAAYLHLPSEVLPSWQDMLAVITRLSISQSNSGTLEAIIELIRAMANNTSFKEATFEHMVDKVSHPVFNPVIPLKHSHICALADAVAEITLARKELANAKELVSKTAYVLLGPTTDNTSRSFCISVLGEIGRRFPECYRDYDDKFEYCTKITEWLDSPVDEIRTSACQALGAFAVGDAALFLPFIVQQIKQKPQLHSQFLNSIREIVNSFDSEFNSVTKAQAGEIWALLVSFMDCQDEGMRLIVADCLGHACGFYDDGLSALLAFVSDSRPLFRHCALHAFRQIVNKNASVLDSFLSNENLGKLLGTLKDEDILARRSSFYVLNVLIHRKFDLIRVHLPEIMPIVYDNTKVRRELITEIEMGPFKMEQDGGVEVRSAAYQVMFSVLEVSPSSVNVEEYVKHLKPSKNEKEQSGIKDRSHDIRTASYMMLLRLISLFPAYLLKMSEHFVDLLKSQFDEKLKSNAVKQDIEKLGELKKMAIKVTYALSNVPGAESVTQLKNLVVAAKDVEENLKKNAA